MSRYSMEFSDFEREMLEIASEFKEGKFVKRFLKKQSKKLSKIQKQKVALIKREKYEDEDLEKRLNNPKSWKTGKVYEFGGDMAVRAYSNSPHAHLLNNGHIIRARGKNLKNAKQNGGRWEAERRGRGREVGFVPGIHFMESAQDEFEEKHYNDTQQFIDDMLNKHGMS